MGEGQQRLDHPSFRHKVPTQRGVYDTWSVRKTRSKAVITSRGPEEKGSLVLAWYAWWGWGQVPAIVVTASP